ncbi:unnamed protein product [Paramecium sonneborni]|uniref:Uncharacterized protein n=1 Tax=Paramecium sonneborni TaxID=65129 RepID=A0A8S1RQC6_9CILI|nr:unnamed protein product [Paramecium sonneborni]
MLQEYIRLIIRLPRYFYMQLDVQKILVKLYRKLQEHVQKIYRLQSYQSWLKCNYFQAQQLFQLVSSLCTVNSTNNASKKNLQKLWIQCY